MQNLVRSLGLAAVGGVFMCASTVASAEEFAALSGVPAEPLTEVEMSEVEGKGWFSIRSRQFSSSSFSFVRVTVNGETQTSSGSGFQTVTISSGGVTVTASSGISISSVTYNP